MKTLNNYSGMPQMGAAFSGWLGLISIVKITQTELNGFVTDVQSNPIIFKGTIQPLTAKEIVLKPEGQRAWGWLQIHCFSGNLNLVGNDRIIYKEKLYKVMNIWDYSLNNYIEYHIIQDFENNPPA